MQADARTRGQPYTPSIIRHHTHTYLKGWQEAGGKKGEPTVKWVNKSRSSGGKYHIIRRVSWVVQKQPVTVIRGFHLAPLSRMRRDSLSPGWQTKEEGTHTHTHTHTHAHTHTHTHILRLRQGPKLHKRTKKGHNVNRSATYVGTSELFGLCCANNRSGTRGKVREEREKAHEVQTRSLFAAHHTLEMLTICPVNCLCVCHSCHSQQHSAGAAAASIKRRLASAQLEQAPSAKV